MKVNTEVVYLWYIEVTDEAQEGAKNCGDEVIKAAFVFDRRDAFIETW